MDLNLLIGIIGSVILVTGAAWPEPKKVIKSTQSTKDRLFFIGSIVLTLFARLGYRDGGPIFFFILEIFVIISGILMMLDTNDTLDLIILSISGLGLTLRSLYLFEGYTTIIFIIGLISIGLGYALTMGSARREAALMIGGILIALFSYLEANRVFFGLNIFFAIFSGYYLIKNIRNHKKHHHK